LKCLEKDSRIAGYQVQSVVENLTADQHQEKNEKCIKIFLNYDLVRNRPLVQKITFYSSQGRKRIATVKTLQQFRIQYPNSLAILGTHKGILSIQDCILNNCGGELLISIA
jgi:ribosomal protein S8